MSRKMLIDGDQSNSTAEQGQYDFDLFVIGAGSGGVRASRTSAGYGAKVSVFPLLIFYHLEISSFFFPPKRRVLYMFLTVFCSSDIKLSFCFTDCSSRERYL